MGEMMEAAIIEEPGKVVFRQVEKPEPKPGEVRIRVKGCGICGSNIPVWEGREWFKYPLPPGNPGHEGWGVVDKVGEGVTGLQPGQPVTMISYNAYAEYDIATAEATVPLPESLGDSPFPGEPLACAINIFNRSEIRPEHTVAVLGVGFLGGLLVRLAARTGARVIGISHRPFALEIATSMGAREVVLMDDHYRIIDEVKKMTNGRFCERVIEATGLQWPLDLGGELTGERGRLIIAGYHQDGLRQVNMQLWNWRGIDVVNAHERDPMTYIQGLRQAVESAKAGLLDPQPLFTDKMEFHRLAEAFETLHTRKNGFVKALVTI